MPLIDPGTGEVLEVSVGPAGVNWREILAAYLEYVASREGDTFVFPGDHTAPVDWPGTEDQWRRLQELDAELTADVPVVPFPDAVEQLTHTPPRDG